MTTLDNILTKVDYLGFSYLIDAKQAILSHPDWEERWEVTDLPEADIQVLRDFYEG